MWESAYDVSASSATDVKRDDTPFPPCYSFRWVQKDPSRWCTSGAKRFIDIAFVLLSLPVLVPVCLAVGLAVRLTSPGPILFLQQRMGRNNHTFTILKFRTLTNRAHGTRPVLASECGKQFTPIGRFLRRWKIDELPQVINVLRGEMSLVGARPKPPEHQVGSLKCRPGITGAATLAFANEGAVLANVPESAVETYFHLVVLPIKWRLDAEYMARATFASDLRLIVNSIMRRWNKSVVRTSAPQAGLGAKRIQPGNMQPHNIRPGKIPARGGNEICLASERIEGSVRNQLCVSCVWSAPWPAEQCVEQA